MNGPGARRTGMAAVTAGWLLLATVAGPLSARAGEAVDFPTAVAAALKRNASVLAAGYEADAAREESRAARGLYLPRVTFEETFLRTNVPAEAFALKLNEERLADTDFLDVRNFNEAPPINDFVAAVALEQPLFAPKAWMGRGIAAREEQAKALDLSRRKEEVVFQVLSAYLDLQTAKEYLDVAERGLSDAREHHRIAEAMERRGVGLASDRLRAKVFLARAEAERVTAENRVVLARTALGLAMGEPGGVQVDAVEPVPPLPEKGVLADRIAALSKTRSDLRAVSLRVENADRRVTFEKSGYLPDVGVRGSYRVDAEDGPFSADNRTWNVGVGLTWNLFDGFRREAAVARAAAERSGARERFRGSADRAAFEVTRAFLAVGESERRLEIARAAAEAAEEGVRLVKARYENQLARMIDLLDAQTALDGARADRVRAENDLLHARARLEEASGTLLPWAMAMIPGTDGKGSTR
ncbi:MAG: TolC family protein [Deltaproteobacteria bacterium]